MSVAPGKGFGSVDFNSNLTIKILVVKITFAKKCLAINFSHYRISCYVSERQNTDIIVRPEQSLTENALPTTFL